MIKVKYTLQGQIKIEKYCGTKLDCLKLNYHCHFHFHFGNVPELEIFSLHEHSKVE